MPHSAHPKTVLITDDEKHMLRVLEFSLADVDCHVETATSGEEALARVSHGDVDLLVIDVRLPGGMNGIETVRALRQQPGSATMPVIVLTGDGAQNCGLAARDVGASLFLTKPFSPRELSRQVKQLLDS